MKKLNKIITLTAALGLALGMSACEKNKDQAQQPIAVYQNCSNCGGMINGSEFFRSESKDITGYVQLALSFVGSNYIQPQYYSYSGSPIVTYNGIVAANGSISINLPMYNNGCVVPAGSYSISTLQAGTWNRTFVSNIRLQAAGPATLVLSIPRAQVSAKRYDQMGQLWTEIPQVGRLFGDLVIESLNGSQCYRLIGLD